MASQTYNGYKVNAMKGGIALLTDTIKVALLSSAYTPDIDNHKFLSDVNANEVSGTGYTAGGNTLASPTVTEDDTNDRAVFGAANPQWTGLTITSARYALIYKSTGVASTSPLICVIDLLTNQTFSNNTFILNFSTSPAGVFYLS